MEGDRISYHESVKKMYEKIKEDKITNIWDRYESQGFAGDPDKRCPFCQGGTRCDLCSNGPCRSDASIDKRGACGITADGMAMRMMLLRNVLGASTYQYHTEQTIKTLRATAKGETPFQIKESSKLKSFAERLGIDSKGNIKEIALDFCDFVEDDFNRKYSEPSKIVELLAPKERKDSWKKIGIFPGGIHGEIMLSTSSCLTNVDGYYVSLALKAMRLGIAMAYQSQIINEFSQDILFGIPRPHKMRVDLGVLDPDYVNVIPNGHEPFLGFAMIQLARKEEWQQKAKKVGAKGLRIIANIETGQEMIQRWEMDDVFYGFTGNWIMQEAIMASGCIDIFVADMNCSMPIDPIYAEKYKFKLIPVSEVVAFEGIKERINYLPEEAEIQAASLLQMAIDNFKERRSSIKPVLGFPIKEAIVGFSTESIVETLGGTIEPLLNAIKDGTIRGVAGMVSCTSLRDSGQDVHTIRIVKELIKRDILVLSLGCGNSAVQVGGLCSLEAKDLAGPGLKKLCSILNTPPVLSYGTCTDVGRLADLIGVISKALGDVSVKDLPVVAVAPEYMEQKATIDAIFALAFGLYTYVNPVPPVTGGPNLVKLLTVDCKDVTGGILNVEKDPVKAAEGMLSHIESKRKKLGI
ncbi:MAG: acetyl-CoA decarbonylase/synthase complex subunit alpha [Candidatus Methanofastidiosum methylothiophilum]|jgi:carbon-monoxide dehydrogenase catalytic subunit|uniref:Carbon monoxide dehydrogenase n=1 Tax=Candidatus Methanofastidiosum methylothiophilum TaxID=1705564 RepID=A0A150JMJ2_9EURY|nr:MAG: acetyl-CoA decarbonylase/synthase complex subunit alpha [Candidatus Methanofastidiosum methylthiophilus]OQC49673.1 MAG: acetyl-CoA decarbonylase/synthase complex subunit alpha [Euryarchaeota archaeon ADurb.Bin023]HNV93639.1 anaerobic carbon-monoxide dehydrogenase catalytic subunit [Methanofastidiosum sp.]KYC57631.1 MAG: acetyl-CoA decarbonylase/synthase complex subunit alpha [Candidatus Methanofastidiosum methylthiophilus]KYC58480.1 MAG: acetyl-CoA decarbonylase/synthase complex subunit